MAASKELYLRDKEEVKRALAITKSDTFERLIMFSKAEFMDRNPTQEELKGANFFLSTLQGLPEDGGQESAPISTGITHDLSVKPKTLGKDK